MAFYAFMTEAPPPRTVFSATPQIDEAGAEEARVFEEKLRAVLVSFPEAYQAVMDEMDRLEAQRVRSP